MIRTGEKNEQRIKQWKYGDIIRKANEKGEEAEKEKKADDKMKREREEDDKK